MARRTTVKFHINERTMAGLTTDPGPHGLALREVRDIAGATALRMRTHGPKRTWELVNSIQRGFGSRNARMASERIYIRAKHARYVIYGTLDRAITSHGAHPMLLRNPSRTKIVASRHVVRGQRANDFPTRALRAVLRQKGYH